MADIPHKKTSTLCKTCDFVSLDWKRCEIPLAKNKQLWTPSKNKMKISYKEMDALKEQDEDKL